MSRKFVLFNKSLEEENSENIQEKESADVANVKRLSLTDESNHPPDDNKDLNSENYDDIGEESFKNENGVDLKQVESNHNEGSNPKQETIDKPVPEPAPTINHFIQNSSSKEKLTSESVNSDSTDHPKLDDLSSIDWHQLTLEEIDEIYLRNKKV